MTVMEISNEPEETLAAIRNGEKFIPLRYHRKKDGTIFPVEISARSQEWEGREVRISVIRDITERVRVDEERKALERQLQQAQKMEAIGTLAGGIAHDFNNILGVILGCSELLLMKASEGTREREHLVQIHKAGERARDLVRQILAFSRQGDQIRTIIRVNQVVKEGLKFLRSTLPSTIEIRSENSREMSILGDPTQVQQVLMNLCVNAAHAMREKGGVLSVEVDEVEVGPHDSRRHAVPGPGCYCRLRVKDTGCGMNQAVIERIFDPYFTTKKPGEGTGLGLSLVHGIVRGHHGGVVVKSDLGRGTTFDVLIPTITRSQLPEGVMESGVRRGKGERVLLVDDEEVLAETMRQMLSGLGYHVVVSTASTEALELFRSCPEKFDLVITDMTMPHMTGLDLAGRLKEIRPSIPVLLCTGSGGVGPEEARKKAGVRILMKPIAMREIADAIRGILDRGFREEEKPPVLEMRYFKRASGL